MRNCALSGDLNPSHIHPLFAQPRVKIFVPYKRNSPDFEYPNPIFDKPAGASIPFFPYTLVFYNLHIFSFFLSLKLLLYSAPWRFDFFPLFNGIRP